MKPKDPNQRYTYYFIDRATKKIRYATVAYSFTQAVKQLQTIHPNDPIQDYVENHAFDYDRKPYVPKAEPQKPKAKSEYQQMDFKGFTDQNN